MPFSCSDSWELPDYLNDLNAMHEAEKILTDPQHRRYRQLLRGVVGDHLCVTCRAHVSATAAQRAEAFLRTIEKWETTTQTETK
jgi:hypothetical protein